MDQQVTLQAAISEFIADRRSLRRRPNTIRSYKGILGCFRAFLVDQAGVDDLPVDAALSRTGMRRFFAELNNRDVVEATVAAYDRTMRAFSKFCLAEGWIETDPMATRPRIKASQRLPDTLSVDEIKKLLATCNEGMPADVRDRCIMLYMLDTGMRAGEICALDPLWCLIQGDRGEITIPGQFAKSHRPRSVFLSSEAVRAWRAWAPFWQGAETVFVALDNALSPTSRPLTPNGLNQAMRRRFERAGIKGHKHLCHIWRHTFAKMFIQAGGDLESLRRLLGHSSLDVTRIYLAFNKAELRDRHARFSPVAGLVDRPAEELESIEFVVNVPVGVQR